jgi:hypothetical protein
MRTIALAVTLLLMALFGKPIFASEGRACASLPVAVQRLGNPWNGDHVETIRELHQCGATAVPLLLEQLRVVDPEKRDAKWRHAVWCERALRSITGQYFRFKSTKSLGQLAEYRSQEDELGYAMEWMSHARIYIAPRDVQEKIIGSWHEWYVEHGAVFEVAPFDAYAEWYW